MATGGERLREVLLGCGLTEEIKWGKPCYTASGKNIAIIQRMNDFLALMFFKGSLLPDDKGVLKKQGANSRVARRMEFTSVQEVTKRARTIKAYVRQAIDIEEAGLKVPKVTKKLVYVDELRDRISRDPALKAAFKALTPGRQREYNFYFSGAKQPKTRAARVEKLVPKILAGKGLRD